MSTAKAIKASLITDKDYLERLVTLLQRATKSIDVLSYSFAIGSAAGKINTKGAPYIIARALQEIKSRKPKIKIRLFTEGLRETVSRNKITAKFLEESGVMVKYGSTHAKGFCIDGKYLLFGSTNLTNQSIQKNFETNLLIEDTSVAKEFIKYFNHQWKGGGHGEVTLKKPLIPDGAFKDELLRIIHNARKRIEFSIYFFNHREIEQALIEAFDRGIKVTGFIHQHASFAYPYIRANRATVKRMRAKGMENLFFGPPHTFSHAKFLVADQTEVIMGTGNWLVEDVTTHPQLYIHLTNKKLGKDLSKYLAYEISHATSD